MRGVRMTRFDFKALGRLPAGTMNKTERAYSSHLDLLRLEGEILWYKFEGIKLRLADNTFYTCDFAVLRSTGLMEMHEIKGFMMDDANVKIKVAASNYPFQFYIVRKQKTGWQLTPVPNKPNELVAFDPSKASPSATGQGNDNQDARSTS